MEQNCPRCQNSLHEGQCLHCSLQREILPHLILTLETSIECLAALAETYRMYGGNPDDAIARETDVIRAAYQARLQFLKRYAEIPPPGADVGS